MKTIAFDVMGNDNGVKPAIQASIQFCKSHLDYYLILVGDRNKIKKYTKETEKIKILHTSKVIDKNMSILKSRHEDSSMVLAIKLVKEGKADVVLSSGSSKHYISLCTIILGRLKGISRPAFMSIIPTIIPNQKFLLLDVGANVEATSDNLIEWAKLGSLFSQEVLHIIKPRIALNNIGTEKDKGHQFQIDANIKLKRYTKMNYIGFLEPRDILLGKADVVVADGYSGNLVLKSLEGAITSVFTVLRSSFTKNIKRKLASSILKPAFQEIKDTLDYRNSGYAWVIGVDAFALKLHGSAGLQSCLSGLMQIYSALEHDSFKKIKAKI